MMDGTSRHVSCFDQLKRDTSCASQLGCSTGELLSLHAVKRFFSGFWFVRVNLFLHLLQKLFIWRLNKQQLAVIEQGFDSMVMDNKDTAVRHGMEPTYTKVKGFHSLQMNWEKYFVVAISVVAQFEPWQNC